MMDWEISFASEGRYLPGRVYAPFGLGPGDRVPGVVVAAPAGLRGEMVSGYATRFADAGFVALVFDSSAFDSETGEVGHQVDSRTEIEDLKSAVTYLEGRPDVNEQRIGACGIGLGGGHLLALAAVDRRIKAVGLVAAVVNPADTCLQRFGRDDFTRRLNALGEASRRAAPPGDGDPLVVEVSPDREAREWRALAEAVTPDADALSARSVERLLVFNAISFARHVAPNALCVVHGSSDTHAPQDYAREVYERARPPKEVHWVPGADHASFIGTGRSVGVAAEVLVRWFGKLLGLPLRNSFGQAPVIGV